MALRICMTLIVLVAQAGSGLAHSRPQAMQSPTFTTHPITLPGATAGGVFMDYLAYDRAHHRVWVPAGNTGSVDVIETSNQQISRIEGFRTAEIERRGTKRIVGPSAATVGQDVVYIGNRADSSVCAVDAVSL